MVANGNKNFTIEAAESMVRQVDTDGDQKINQQEFQKLMLPVLMDELVSQEDNAEDMREKFKAADTDYSGFLTVDEFYACLLSMEIMVSKEEVISFFSEFDQDNNQKIDIDEFVRFFVGGDDINLQQQQNIDTYNKIKKKRNLKALDFLRAFDNMPSSFSYSFVKERWDKKRNLPSSVFKAHIDPSTMLWKDFATPDPDELAKRNLQKDAKPRTNPVKTSLGAEIRLDTAEGVPMPGESKSQEEIVKRLVRLAIYDDVKKELIANTA